MKKILALMLLTCSLAFTSSYGQSEKRSPDNIDNLLNYSPNIVYPMQNVLVCDETYMSDINKATFKVTCSNEDIACIMWNDYDNLYTRINVLFKCDRLGRYKEYTFYVPAQYRTNLLKRFELFRQVQHEWEINPPTIKSPVTNL